MKHSFASITKQISRTRAGLSDPRIMHPEREWFIGLSVAVGIFLLGAAFSANLYIRNRTVSASIDAVSNEEVLYREGLVKDALRLLSEREGRLQALLAGVGSTAIESTTSDGQPETIEIPEAVDVFVGEGELLEVVPEVEAPPAVLISE